MRFNWKLELPQLVLAASMLVTALVVWPSAPDRIPIHWNLEGEVDAYGGKFMGLLFLPLLSVGLYLLFLFLPRIDPGRANYSGFAGTYGVIRFSIMVVMAVIYAATLLVMRGHAVRMETVVPLLIGGMFMVLGAVIGKCGRTGSSACGRRGRCRASSRGRRRIASRAGCSSGPACSRSRDRCSARRSRSWR
jgi:uncharacterized membrane protein